MPCAICRIRKPRRFCPGVNGDICTLCCGQEREVTVDCPFDCPFLQEARKHERTEPWNPKELPNQDIRVTEEFLEEHQHLLLSTSMSIMGAAADTAGSVDRDVREALDALISTQRTLQSGLYYETHPANVLADRIMRETMAGLEEFRRTEHEDVGLRHTRESDILTVLVFLQRLAMDRDNGRPRCRAFLDSLRGFLAEAEEVVKTNPQSSLIVP
jgi:hypothetical protein